MSRPRQPAWIVPMLATLIDDPFSEEGWLFERKLDGERCLAFCHGDELRQPRFQGLPIDKRPREVVLERPR